MRTCIDDPVGSSIVEILHRVEGGDVEQWFEPRNIFSCLRLSTSLYTLLSLLLALLFVYSLASFNIVVFIVN